MSFGRLPVKVHVRVRPLPSSLQCDVAGDSKRDPADGFIEVNGSLLQLHDVGKQHTSQFAFDDVFGSQAGQAQLHDAIGQPLVEHVLAGYNACCFAYGQTGSGKTYSMVGEVQSSRQCSSYGFATNVSLSKIHLHRRIPRAIISDLPQDVLKACSSPSRQ